MFNLLEQLIKTPEKMVHIFIQTPPHLVLEQIAEWDEPELQLMENFISIYIQACQSIDMQADIIMNQVGWVVRYLQYIQSEVVIARTRLKHIKDYTN